MSRFNEGRTERKVFLAILLCGAGGGWFSNFVTQQYKLANWLGTMLGIVFTAGLFLVFAIVLVLVDNWRHQRPRQTGRDTPSEDEWP